MHWHAATSPTEPDFYCVARSAAGVSTVEVDGLYTLRQAEAIARDLNRQHQRANARRAQEPDRYRIPAGFYTDKDAA